MQNTRTAFTENWWNVASCDVLCCADWELVTYTKCSQRRPALHPVWSHHSSSTWHPITIQRMSETCCWAHQVGAVRSKASEERLYEAERLLTNLAEQRQMASDAVTAAVLLRKQQLHDSRSSSSSSCLTSSIVFRHASIRL